MITLLIFAFCDYSITNRLPQPDYVERDWQWMQADPNAMESYFRIYSEVEKEPHVHLVMRNWLEYNPRTRSYTGPLRPSGRAVAWDRQVYEPGVGCISKEHWEIGNINGDDVVDLVDFAISAKHFKGGLYKPKPKPEPVVIPIEIKALIMKLLMDD